MKHPVLGHIAKTSITDFIDPNFSSRVSDLDSSTASAHVLAKLYTR